jgi:hypothetical protein
LLTCHIKDSVKGEAALRILGLGNGLATGRRGTQGGAEADY